SPNPTDGQVTISFTATGNEKMDVEISGYDGRVVWNAAITSRFGSNSLKVENLRLQAGIYLVRMKTSAGNLVKKLIIR
ncbi:MAG: T9SS type A sorting domain-containing protein, partial [Bacteroidota bacterium]